MGPLWWFYLMLVFWLSWLMISMNLFYWFNLSSWMTSNPLFFFFFFFYFCESELILDNNIISLINNMNFCYYYEFDTFMP
uniref:ATP synthase F0 subunit 8 n=1 Tax=Bemisia tabaci TaxID=7038 RepID=A0A678NAC1_BEMTA|nr:ATP synthase F0 subunit 8 [Bemisia tabaci]